MVQYIIQKKYGVTQVTFLPEGKRICISYKMPDKITGKEGKPCRSRYAD